MNVRLYSATAQSIQACIHGLHAHTFIVYIHTHMHI